MGITKFASLAAAEQALWVFQPDRNYFERVRGLFELAEYLISSNDEPGLRKYHSLEERAALLEKQ